MIDDELNTIELAVESGRPIKEVVQDVQQFLHQAVGETTTVLVRVQSLPLE